jgi:hypothetical protein
VFLLQIRRASNTVQIVFWGRLEPNKCILALADDNRVWSDTIQCVPGSSHLLRTWTRTVSQTLEHGNIRALTN